MLARMFGAALVALALFLVAGLFLGLVLFYWALFLLGGG